MNPLFRDRVKPATCLLLTLCHAGTAAALGLGELQVRSHLGQPFHAAVTLLEAGAEVDASCFSVAPGSDRRAYPGPAQLSLERTAGAATLHIRSREAVLEPFAQFVLVSDCEARLQRDYVVLLDPPPLHEPVKETALAAVAAPPRATVATPRVQEKSPASAPAPRPRAPRGERAAPPQPRLVLSGGRASSSPLFALKLDTRLPDFAPRAPDLTATELSDENTALNHKLTHLETQLAALRKRNAELDRQARAPVAPPPEPEAEPRWPLYLLALGAVGASLGLATAWLRRRPARTLQFEDSTWTLLKEEPPSLAEGDRAAAVDEDLPAFPDRLPEVAAPQQEAGTEVKEDILDQAEVFMAHGHANLAIHLLQEHLREAPTESPVPWLLLLDLLHREGDAAGYAAASAECRRYFNVDLSDHPVSQDSERSLGLEAYPHLLDRLVHVWQSPERDEFFKDLIYDHRGGTRMGFHPAAYRDILLLRAIAQATPLARDL